MLGECDRRGFSELFTPEGRSIVLPTTCKTWGCVVCRKKLLALFRARVEVGVSHIGRSVFMTITYLEGSVRLQGAQCVQKDWQALWRNLKRAGHDWKWLKVTELTEKGTPHHHVVIGPVSGVIRCHGKTIKKGRETYEYMKRIKWCECTAHIFSRTWQKITGDSFMCFAVAVTNSSGAGTYMSKYMQKNFMRPTTGRRFTTSRDWPGGQRIRLAVTLAKGWSHIQRWEGSWFPNGYDLNPNEKDLLVRVGDDITMKIARRNSKKAARARFGKILGRKLT